jgi:hypothetical protein
MSEEREHSILERADALKEQAGRREGRREQQSVTSGAAEPSLKGLKPAVGESLEEIAKGEHQGP